MARRAPRHITYGALVPLPPDQACAFVADPLRWPAFFGAMRDATKDDDWPAVGARARSTNVVLGRTFTSELEMTMWDPPREFRYVAVQAGAPPLTNRRVLEVAEGGTLLRASTEMTPRAGVKGLLDRVQAMAVQRMFVAAMLRLPDAARAAGPSMPA